MSRLHFRRDRNASIYVYKRHVPEIENLSGITRKIQASRKSPGNAM